MPAIKFSAWFQEFLARCLSDGEETISASTSEHFFDIFGDKKDDVQSSERRITWGDAYKEVEEDFMTKGAVINSKFMYLFTGDKNTVGETKLIEYFDHEGHMRSFLPAFLFCRMNLQNSTDILEILKLMYQNFADNSAESEEILKYAGVVRQQLEASRMDYRSPEKQEEQLSESSDPKSLITTPMESPQDEQGASLQQVQKKDLPIGGGEVACSGKGEKPVQEKEQESSKRSLGKTKNPIKDKKKGASLGDRDQWGVKPSGRGRGGSIGRSAFQISSSMFPPQPQQPTLNTGDFGYPNYSAPIYDYSSYGMGGNTHLYPDLQGEITKFPFLESSPPSGLFCEVLNKEHMKATLIKDCVGVAQEKLNCLNFSDAWRYADAMYFIPMIDQRRSYYNNLEKGEKVQSPLVDEIVASFSAFMEDKEKVESNTEVGLKQILQAIDGLSQQLYSAGLALPRTLEMRPSFQSAQLSKPSTSSSKDVPIFVPTSSAQSSSRPTGAIPKTTRASVIPSVNTAQRETLDSDDDETVAEAKERSLLSLRDDEINQTNMITAIDESMRLAQEIESFRPRRRQGRSYDLNEF